MSSFLSYFHFTKKNCAIFEIEKVNKNYQYKSSMSTEQANLAIFAAFMIFIGFAIKFFLEGGSDGGADKGGKQRKII